MKVTIGIFAHVDAGKTTFSESILHLGQGMEGSLQGKAKGNILDHNPIEKERGITIFSDISSFLWKGQEFQLIDTPGHTGFSAEMEQTISVLDIAILLINGTKGVQSHTMTLQRLLKKNKIPTYLFINKLDLGTSDFERTFKMLQQQLMPDSYCVTQMEDFYTTEYVEWLADYDALVLEEYIN